MGWKDRAEKVESSWRDRAEVAEEAPKASRPVYGSAASALQGAGQAMTFGYLPELQAAAAPALAQVYELFTGNAVDSGDFEDNLGEFRQRDVAMSRQNPVSYNVGQVGGAVALPVPILGAAKNAGLLSTVGRAAGVGAATGAAYNPHAGETGTDTSLRVGDRLGNATIGGILGGGAQGLISGVSKAAGGVPSVIRSLQEVDQAPVLKPGSEKILAAGKELGIEPSAGMLYDSTILQGLESSLDQSPTIAGHLVRKNTRKIGEGLQSTAKNLVDDSSSLSKFEAGEKLKRDIMADIGEKLGPAEMAFDDLRAVTKDIEIFPKGSTGRDPRRIIARNIENIDEVRAVPNAAWAQDARQWSNAVQNAKTTQDVTIIRSALGNELAEASGTRRKVLGQIYDKLTQLEENSIKRGAISSARTKGEGTKVAKEMIGQMRDAKKTYRGVAEGLKDFSSVSGLKGSKNPQTFVRTLDKMKSEELLKKLSNTEDVRLMRTLKESYPEQFNVVRQKKLADIVEKATNKDKVDIGKFLRATKSLSPEAKELLFGSPEAVKKYDAIRTVFESFPDKMGPSGTPQGLQFQNMLSPAMQAQEFARYKLYQFMQTKEGQAKIRDILNNLDRVNPAAMRIEGLLNKATPGLLAPAVERTRQ